MATSSVPTINMSARWGDPQQGSSQSSTDKNNSSLEMAMSGMNIVSAFGSSPVEFSATPDMQSEFSEELSGHQRKHIIDSGDSVHSQRSNNSNASPLPSKPIHRLHGVPPIGRPGHSKSSSISTSQSLTLTPTSSVDGADAHDFKRGKEEQEPPTRITTTIGDGFDSVHGARERANTAPGTMGFPSPLDNNFGSSTGHPPRSGVRDGNRNQLPPSRPPLAGSPSYNSDSSTIGSLSRIGYPPHSGDNFLQRSISDSGRQESLLSSAYPAQMEQQSNKLSSFPSIPSQSGLNPNQPSFQPISRHQRSQSGPAPDYMNQYQQHSEPPRGHTRQVSDYGVSSNDHGHRPPPMRYRNHSFGSAEEVSRADLHRRSSLQTLPSAGGFYGQNHHDRRESLDFVPGHDMFMNDYERSRHVSPGNSPLHQHYGHHRSESYSGPSMAMAAGGMRSTGGKRNSYSQPPRHHRVPSLDDDLSHPLAGESIEVPSDDRGYMLDSSAHSVPSLRSSSAEPSHYLPEATQHLPTAGASLPLAKVVYSVKFKRTQRSFVIGPRLNRDLKIGTYVKVEADRGEDLGIVVGKVSPEKRNYRGGDMSIMPPATGITGNNSDLKRIIRLATHDEVSLLSMKRDEEEELLKICRTKVRQRGLPMNVVDAEYQFDRHKLTFFFEAEGRVDFRELVRDLFSMYKTRIWMQQLDKNTSATCRAAVNPPAPVVMDYGTPIIAPVSEFREFVTGIETD